MVARKVNALERCFAILNLFLNLTDALTVPEITERSGLPRTTVHELVATMVAWSYLEPVPDRPRAFRLGIRLFELGSRYLERLDLAGEGKMVAAEVANACGETVHLAVLEGKEVIYIAKVDSRHAVRMASAVGMRLPAHCTAVGKCLLAQLPDEELTRLYPSDESLVAMTATSHKSVTTLMSELVEVRRSKIAYDNCESNYDVRCVASPVFGSSGRALAGLSVSVPISRWSEDRQREYEALLALATQGLSRRLGYVLREATEGYRGVQDTRDTGGGLVGKGHRKGA